MELYLVQHGAAMSEAENPERPLTVRGREDVQRVSAFVARLGLRPAESGTIPAPRASAPSLRMRRSRQCAEGCLVRGGDHVHWAVWAPLRGKRRG